MTATPTPSESCRCGPPRRGRRKRLRPINRVLRSAAHRRWRAPQPVAVVGPPGEGMPGRRSRGSSCGAVAKPSPTCGCWYFASMQVGRCMFQADRFSIQWWCRRRRAARPHMGQPGPRADAPRRWSWHGCTPWRARAGRHPASIASISSQSRPTSGSADGGTRGQERRRRGRLLCSSILIVISVTSFCFYSVSASPTRLPVSFGSDGVKFRQAGTPMLDRVVGAQLSVAWRRATTTPARQPGARPPLGGCIPSTSRPLRAMSHEITEFEFHISPAWSSSRPQTGVGTPSTSSRKRSARPGSSVRRWGLRQPR